MSSCVRFKSMHLFLICTVSRHQKGIDGREWSVSRSGRFTTAKREFIFSAAENWTLPSNELSVTLPADPFRLPLYTRHRAYHTYILSIINIDPFDEVIKFWFTSWKRPSQVQCENISFVTFVLHSILLSVGLLTHIRKVLGSNLRRDTRCPNYGFFLLWPSPIYLGEFRGSTYIRPWPLPSKSLRLYIVQLLNPPPNRNLFTDSPKRIKKHISWVKHSVTGRYGPM
jgi:hypothetical protein